MLIGISSTLNLLWYGRITGMSGIFNSLVKFDKEAGFYWKFCFFTGLISVPSVLYYTCCNQINLSMGTKTYNLIMFDQLAWTTKNLNLIGMIVAGILVGFGTRMGNGCTSGHSVCGIPRLSVRSIVATCCFMATAMAIATLRFNSPFF